MNIEYILIVLNAIFYFGLNLLIRRITAKTRLCGWLFRNTLCSFLHAVILSILSTICIVTHPILMTDLITSHSLLSTYAIAASAGYFMYDIIDVIVNDGFHQWILILHHIVIMFGFPYCIWSTYYHGFAICALLMEWNSIFLHGRRLLRMVDFKPKDFIFILNALLLGITMFFFRCILCIYLVYYIWYTRDQMSWPPFLIGSSATIIFIPANIGLCYRIYSKDYGSVKGREKTK